jgi:hypothetical protein
VGGENCVFDEKKTQNATKVWGPPLAGNELQVEQIFLIYLSLPVVGLRPTYRRSQTWPKFLSFC